jgi:hypothetical protein
LCCNVWTADEDLACHAGQVFINTAAKIYHKIEEGIFDVSNEVSYMRSATPYIVESVLVMFLQANCCGIHHKRERERYTHMK